MNNGNEWKRVTGSRTPSNSTQHGNERYTREGRDGSRSNYNGGSRERYPAHNPPPSHGQSGYNQPSHNYGNRMEDKDYNYERGNDSGYDSGYIDLNSAVDSVPGKTKRKRIVKDAGANAGASVQDRPYKKVDLQRRPKRPLPPPAPKKIKPVAPEYPDVVFDKPVRLNRYISNTGLCSRREADEYIKQGFIKVNGDVVIEMGTKVNPTDDVSFKDKSLNNQRKIYLLLNKPKGFVTSMADPNCKKIVMDLVRSACRERIYPVGRLDKMTTGVLLFTNDGDLSLKLTHPSNRMRKVYQVMLDKDLPEADMEKLSQGIDLEDGPVAFDSIAYADYENHNQVGVEIHSGKNRIVRRMFEAAGYKVIKLDRVYFAGLTRKGLKRGKWRFLTPEEVAFLKMMPSAQ
ncbi:MAG: rRNA pseudouridine synthase [Bacteroidales bacterium]|jgi:23S rRNA pseudouridine2605 synthase|nr:rRNA pseudouridine synthase [Bacteroidales bacterium]